MNKFEKRDLVIKLYNEGKIRKKIAQIVHMSFRDISMIIKEYEKEKENENKQYLLQNKPKRSKESKAYGLFLRGKTPIKVSIELNIDYDHVKKLYLDFWRLHGLHELYNIYSKNKSESINLIKLNSILQNNNIKENEVIYTIKNSNRLLVSENKIKKINDNLEHTIEAYNYYASENKKLEKKNFNLKEKIKLHKNYLKTLKFACDYNNERLENIKKLIEKHKITDDFEQIKNITFPSISKLVNSKFYLLNSTIENVFEIIRNDADKKIILEYLEKKNYYSDISRQYLENNFIPNKKREIVNQVSKEIKDDLTDSVMETLAD